MRFHPLLYLLYPFVAGAFLAEYIAARLAYAPTAMVWSHGWLVIIAGRDDDGATRIWGQPGGQCWGTFACAFATILDSVDVDLNVHERTHLWQALVVNAIAHALLVPLGLHLGGWHLLWTIVLAQATFGTVYGGHFLWWRYVREAPRKLLPDGTLEAKWHAAYMRICFEVHAYRVQREFIAGKRPKAWR